MTNNSSQYSPDEETNFSGIEIFLLYELRMAGTRMSSRARPGCVRRIFMTFEYTDTGRPGRARYYWWENYDFVPNYLEIMSVRIPLRIVSI